MFNFQMLEKSLLWGPRIYWSLWEGDHTTGLGDLSSSWLKRTVLIFQVLEFVIKKLDAEKN